MSKHIRMQTPTDISLTADKSVCYERIVNSMLAELPDDYEHLEDVFELKDLCYNIDCSLRR